MKKLFFISALMLTVFCGKVSAGNFFNVTLSNGLTFSIDRDRYPTMKEIEKFVNWLEIVTKGWGNDNPYITQGSSFFGEYDDDPFN